MNFGQKLIPPKLIWVYTDSLDEQLDAATWLDTTGELRRLGWEVTLINEGPPSRYEINGVAVTTVQKKNVYLIRQLIFHMQVLKIIFQSWDSVDVILFHQMSAPWMLPLKLVRKLGGRERPLVVMDTRTMPMIPKEAASMKDRVRTIFDGLMNRAANHLADGQTAITRRMADVMKIPQRQLLGVWPSGVDLEQFAPAWKLREWHSAAKEVQLIYIGALHIQRRLMDMCQAVEAANASGKHFVFTIVGWGTEQDQLEEFARHSNGCVRVLPAVPHDQVPDLLAQAHVGVLPFPDQERFRVSSPIKLFEYMASGLPILATRIVCHTDVVKDGAYVFWSAGVSQEAHALALAELWECRDQLPLLGEQAVSAAANWTWQAAAMKLDNALRSALMPSAVEMESH